MKGIKIANIVNLLLIITLELLPFGVVLKWVDDGGMRSTSYHSYFESIPWSAGNFGPLLCAIITVVTLSLMLVSFFIEDKKAFLITLCILPWLALICSLVSIIFNAYTLLGGIISALLLISAEMNFFIYSRTFNKK